MSRVTHLKEIIDNDDVSIYTILYELYQDKYYKRGWASAESCRERWRTGSAQLRCHLLHEFHTSHQTRRLAQHRSQPPDQSRDAPGQDWSEHPGHPPCSARHGRVPHESRIPTRLRLGRRSVRCRSRRLQSTRPPWHQLSGNYWSSFHSCMYFVTCSI